MHVMSYLSMLVKNTLPPLYVRSTVLYSITFKFAENGCSWIARMNVAGLEGRKDI